MKATLKNFTADNHAPFEADATRKNGEVFPIEVRTRKMEFYGKNVQVASVRDLTERKNLEKKVTQTQKMQAIGTLAGGIAHDFNNILAAILGFTEISLHKDECKGEIKDNLENILTAGRRAKELVDQILAFSRKSDVKMQNVVLKDVVGEALGFLRNTIPATVDVRARIDEGKLKVWGNYSQIQQIVINLTTNSYQSMKESGGVLEISIDKLSSGSADLPTELAEKKTDYARLGVKDSGKGISPENLERIFDPFFTTKGPGEGTGMGLSMVHGIVEAHQGIIKTSSSEDEGTTMMVYLPLVEGAGPQPEAQALSPEQSYSARILAIDDDPPDP